MVVNIVKRYGVIPKKSYIDSFSSTNTINMNSILNTKAREFTKELRDLINDAVIEDILEEKIEKYMEEFYRIISISLGVPPETFTWENINNENVYSSVGPITPLKFYEEYVKPFCNLEELICLVNDPRPDNPYGKTYTIDCLGNMVGGRITSYINIDMQDLLKYAANSIKANEAVWMGCEVDKRYSVKLGIQDLKLHDYQLLFGIDINNDTKAERLLYGESCINHAMAFTGVSLNADDTPTKFRVENSWGDDTSEKGYMMMTSEWFKEFGFIIVVNKKHLPKEVIDMLQIEPKVLPAWDPMGSLAL